MKATAQQSSNFERTIFPEGMYPMTLKKSFVMWGKPSQYAPEGAPKIAMIWEYTDEEGATFELMDFHTFPKDFAYNDKSNFWKRLAEIAGVTITKDNVQSLDVDINFGEFIQSYDELIEHIKSSNDQGRPEKAEVLALTVSGKDMIGKQCQLVVKVWQNGDKEGNTIASVIQMGAAQKPLKPQKAAPKQQAPTKQTGGLDIDAGLPEAEGMPF